MNYMIANSALPPTTQKGLDMARKMEQAALARPQVAIETEHLLHGSVYTRTIRVPAMVMITGALIRIPTTLTVSGKATIIFGDNDEVVVDGFGVFPASAGRKQVFVAHTDTFISMSFKTNATSVREAEEEFTDEGHMLKSRDGKNNVVVTEE